MTAARVIGRNYTKVLITLSVLLVAISAYNLWRFSGSAYFAATGKPLGFAIFSSKPVYKRVLPKFSSTVSQTAASLNPGDTETITVSAKSDKTVSAFLDVWVASTNFSQIWKSPSNNTILYKAGQQVTKVYSFTLPASTKPGVYSVSLILNSGDSNTDYLVRENVAHVEVL